MQATEVLHTVVPCNKFNFNHITSLVKKSQHKFITYFGFQN